MTAKNPFVAYAVVAEGGSGCHFHSRLISIAFSWDEVKEIIDGDRNHPVTADRWIVEFRARGQKKTGYLTVWKHNRWDEVEKRKDFLKMKKIHVTAKAVLESLKAAYKWHEGEITRLSRIISKCSKCKKADLLQRQDVPLKKRKKK